MDLEPLIVAAAKAGQDFHIAAGTYPPFYLRGAVAAKPIRITGDVGVVLSDMVAQEPKGLTFAGLNWIRGGTQPAVVNIQGGSDIHFEDCEILGQGAQSGGLAISFSGSPNCSVVRCHIHDITGGIGAKQAEGLRLDGNDFHDLEIDGMQTQQSSHVAITNNTLTDFYPKPGDHSDAIQFVGVAGHVADGIVITGNVYTRGRGIGAQGVFVGDENGQRYTNMTVLGNAVVGGDYNGMTFGSAEGLTYRDNLVQAYADHGSSLIIDPGTTFKDAANNLVSNVAVNPGATPPPAGAIAGKPVATVGDLSALASWSKSLASAPATPPPAADPRDAQIAELTARLTAMRQAFANIVTLAKASNAKRVGPTKADNTAILAIAQPLAQ